ncbi:hypothetical protein NITUZ_40420 [Candidatus Nitrosotenuis uzonensis]|uniref:Uncharacterized protein n=1 Tax=Candidatus Nitrosotenuis uzonensis TaxID=1407055 RepID=V6AUN5_9ARCH|nr:hypothetical protein NITUZ_40420 [Candidatus Nitrosotenuis uzonensis]
MRILIVFLIYGTLVAIANISIIGQSGEHIFYYVLNFPVERFVISPILLHQANETNYFISSHEIIILRLVSGLLFWGMIGAIIQIGKKQFLKKKLL